MADETGIAMRLGRRIAEQRKCVGMKAVDLANRIGVHRNTLAKWEKGETEPSSGEVLRIGAALGCGIMELLAPSREQSAPCFAFRAHKALTKNPEILVKARKYLRAYDEIETILGTRLPGKLRSYAFDPEQTPWRQWVEYAAEDLRDQSGMRNRSPEDIPIVLENLGVRCLFFHSDIKGLDGFSTVYEGLPFVMLRDRERGIERTIFSAAHELGHLVLHPELFTDESEKVEDGTRDHEKEAHYFAGCFLVPGDDLIRVWKEEQLRHLDPVSAILILKAVFRVSFFCLFHRLRDLDLCDVEYPAMVQALKKHLGIKGTAKIEDLEPSPLPSEALQRTTRFQRLAENAFLRDEIGVSKVAELFQIPVDEAKLMTTGWVNPNVEMVA